MSDGLADGRSAARDVELDTATGVSPARRWEETRSIEITIEPTGEDRGSRPLHPRLAVFCPDGAVHRDGRNIGNDPAASAPQASGGPARVDLPETNS